MKRLTIEDSKFVKKVMLHHSVFDFICDDGTDDPDVFRNAIDSLLSNPNVYFISSGPGCVYMLMPSATGMYAIHTCILPKYRGKTAIEYGKDLIKYCFDELNFNKLISYIPSYNRAAHVYALKCGLNTEGVLKDAWLKSKKTHDLVLVGLSKKEFQSCQQQPQRSS